MGLLTGGLTHEADTFVIAAGTVLLIAILYPLIGGLALLAFPVVFIGAVLARRRAGRREARRSKPVQAR